RRCLSAIDDRGNARDADSRGRRSRGEVDGPGEAATRGQADGGRRGLTRDERNGPRGRGEREIRTSGIEELQGRGSAHVPLTETAAAPDVLQEFRDRIVTVRSGRLVREFRRRTAESHVD